MTEKSRGDPDRTNDRDEPFLEEPIFAEASSERGDGGSSRWDDELDEPVFPDSDGEREKKRRSVSSAIAVGLRDKLFPSSPRPASQEGADPNPGGEEHLFATRRRRRRLGRTAPFWIIGAVVVALIVLVVWLAVRGGGDEVAGEPLLEPVVGVTGSTELPAEAELIEPALEDAENAEEAVIVPPPLLAVGQEVVVGNTDGSGIRLRNEPGLDGVTLAIYQEGEQFVVLNPDGDYESYPVQADDYAWYRIQVAGNRDENLSGWAAGEFLVPVGAEDEPQGEP